MSEFRIATKIPHDADKSPDWGQVLTEQAVVKELMKRADTHRGAGFKLRERSEDYGVKRQYFELDKQVHLRLNKKFEVGSVLVAWAMKDDVQWLIRRVETEPKVVNVPSGNDGIDVNHSLIFGKEGRKKHPRAESWGILNKRYIAGTTIWSQHSPWPQDSCTSNAEDFHAPTLAEMQAICNDVEANGRVEKMLLAGREWLPGTGWRYVGSYIDHFDHAHIEPLPTRGGQPC